MLRFEHELEFDPQGKLYTNWSNEVSFKMYIFVSMGVNIKSKRQTCHVLLLLGKRLLWPPRPTKYSGNSKDCALNPASFCYVQIWCVSKLMKSQNHAIDVYAFAFLNVLQNCSPQQQQLQQIMCLSSSWLHHSKPFSSICFLSKKKGTTVHMFFATARGWRSRREDHPGLF